MNEKKRIRIKNQLAFWTGMLDKLQAAYEALVSGGVQAYMIDDRQLTKLDLNALSAEMERAEQKIDELEALLAGGGRRWAAGVVPMDW